MKSVIFHIDVNSAFLSWEAVYRLKHLHDTVDLREMVSAVGGSSQMRHGIILAKSVKCKAFNIKTGESIMEAKNKCPNLLVVPPHYQLYTKCSRAFISVLREYTPDVEQYSIDEAFMDMTGTQELWGDPIHIAGKIKDRIQNDLGFTVNIGISSNKLLAKMASELKKPNRIHTLFPEEIPEKMWTLPVTDLFFVGRAAFKKVHLLGVRTIGDLAHTNIDLLKLHLKSHGEMIWNYANGIDDSKVVSEPHINKGYGNSTTTPYDICSLQMADMVILSLSETIGMRLRKDNAKIEVISVHLKYSDFSHASHQTTLSVATNITFEIYQAAAELFRNLWKTEMPVRLIGIHTSHVSYHNAKEPSDGRQLSLWDLTYDSVFANGGTKNEKLEKADKMVDEIRMKYGVDSIKRATFMDSPIYHATGGISKEKHTVDYTIFS
ncbi:MAG: DNA polymerase IV [Lachnoclostridium sp.]|jgi:DNA polymerase-4|nr:DNA polymerase IV [Lachnoclostridium sp.]